MIACRDGHDIPPVAHIALPIIIIACRDDRPVRFQSDRVSKACRDFSFMQIPIANLIAALERILIPGSQCKCLCRSFIVLFLKQSFALAVFFFFERRLRVAVIASRLTRRYCAVIVAYIDQLFNVPHTFSLCRRVLVFTSRLIRRYCAVVIARCQQVFSLLVLRFFGFRCRVAVIASRLIGRCCTVVIARCQHRFTLGVLRLFDLRFCVLIFAQCRERRNSLVILPIPCHFRRCFILHTRNNHQFSNRDNRHNRNHCNRYVSSTSSLLRFLLVHPFLSELFAHLRLFPTVLVIAQSSKAPYDFSVMEI